MSSSKRRTVRSVYESVAGTTPTSPVLQSHCKTSINLAANPQNQQSNKTCGGTSRGRQGTIRFGSEPGGGWEFEHEFGDQDWLFPAFFRQAWSQKTYKTNREGGVTQITAVTAASDTFTVTGSGPFAAGEIIRTHGFSETANNGVFVLQASTTNTALIVPNGLVNETPGTTAEVRKVGVEALVGDVAATTSGGNALTSSALDFTDYGLTAGEWVYIGGQDDNNKFLTAGCNGYARVSEVAAARLDLDVVPTGFATDSGSGKTIRLFIGDFIKDASTKLYVALQDAFLDHSPVDYRNLNGNEGNTFSLNMPAKSVVTGSVEFVGRSVGSTQSQYSGATVIEGRHFPSISTGANVARIAENGTVLGGNNYVNNLTLQVTNGAARRNGLGVDGSVGISDDFFDVTGSMDTYFDDLAILSKIDNNEESSLDFALKDSQGHALMYDMPRIEFTGGDPQDNDPDVTLPTPFQALEHQTLGYTLSVTRFWCVDDTSAAS